MTPTHTGRGAPASGEPVVPPVVVLELAPVVVLAPPVEPAPLEVGLPEVVPPEGPVVPALVAAAVAPTEVLEACDTASRHPLQASARRKAILHKDAGTPET